MANAIQNKLHTIISVSQSRRILSLGIMITFMALTISALETPPAQATLQDGLTLQMWSYQNYGRQPFNIGAARGEIRMDVFLPDSAANMAQNRTIPITRGVEIRYTFDMQGGDRTADLPFQFNLRVPGSARRWLTPLKESDMLRNLSQNIRGSEQTIQCSVYSDLGWYLTLPVTDKANAGSCAFSVTINNQKVADFSFELINLPARERQEWERSCTVFFFSEIAYPRFVKWCRENNNRLPGTSEFLDALETLEYAPALNEYTARRGGLPKTFAAIRDPSNTWLARELRDSGLDRKLVVVTADGIIKLARASDFSRDDDR